MGRERKPRTNDEALDRFALSVTSNSVGPSYDVNSMILRGDEIYHYGSHYPMAKIVRKTPKKINGVKVSPHKDYDGPVIMVLVNSTRWDGQTGFGWSTNATVATLRSRIERHAAPLGIPVYSVPLTSGGLVYKMTDEDDPQPVVPSLRDIPVCPRKNPPTDPGPEPIKSEHGCIAGHFEIFESQSESYIFGESTEIIVQDQAYALDRGGYGYRSTRPGSFFIGASIDGSVKERIAEMRGIVYGEESYEYQSSVATSAKEDNPGVRFDYKQCPHCKAHAVKHRNWQARMFGGYDAHFVKHKMGWLTYCEYIDKFGGIEQWRAARSALVKLQKQRKKELAEWVKRNGVDFNHIPQKYVGNVRIPVLDYATGRISPKVFDKIKRDELKRQRDRVREMKRRERENRRLAIERKKREEEAAKRLAELREMIEAGKMVDDTALEWLARHGVKIVNDEAIMYKRVHHNTFNDTLVSRSGTSPFEYKVGEWAIAEDYRPTATCGHGLHFAESPEKTDFHYGNTIIECRVPLASLIQMGYKVKAERAFVVRIVSEEEN